MEKLYAIHGGGSIYAVIKAVSEEKAFDIFAKSQINNEFFSEHITRFVVNDSLLEDFYKDDKGSFHDDYTGGFPKRLKNMKNEEREKYIDEWIEKNIRTYWHDQLQFAEEYLNELHKSYESEGFYHGQFSVELMIDTIKRLINSGNWYDDFDIVEIDLTKNDYQIIYND